MKRIASDDLHRRMAGLSEAVTVPKPARCRLATDGSREALLVAAGDNTGWLVPLGAGGTPEALSAAEMDVQEGRADTLQAFENVRKVIWGWQPSREPSEREFAVLIEDSSGGYVNAAG